MIAFKDFVPQEVQPGGFLTAAQYELIDATVQDANDWIREQSVHVLNVETVVLPNLWQNRRKGTGDAVAWASGDMASYWCQFVRVWYTQE